ncbi:MAG: dockerin type I domain-containing protein [Planctomycetota bacterium]
MSRTLSIALLICVVAPAFGQGIAPGGPGNGVVTMSVPADVSATVGGTVSIPISVSSTDNTVNFFVADASCDGTTVAFTSIDPSAGLQQHIADNGLPPNCDIIIYPNLANIFMLPFVPYDITQYGAEYFIVNLDVLTTQPGTTDVTFQLMVGNNPQPVTTTITIDAVGDPSFMRGDVNNDASCNISDAVSLLGFLFSSGSTPQCLDGADVNDDGSITIADPVRLLSGLFGTAPPVDEGCLVDTIATDALDCVASSCP